MVHDIWCMDVIWCVTHGIWCVWCDEWLIACDETGMCGVLDMTDETWCAICDMCCVMHHERDMIWCCVVIWYSIALWVCRMISWCIAWYDATYWYAVPRYDMVWYDIIVCVNVLCDMVLRVMCYVMYVFWCMIWYKCLRHSAYNTARFMHVMYYWCCMIYYVCHSLYDSACTCT